MKKRKKQPRAEQDKVARLEGELAEAKRWHELEQAMRIRSDRSMVLAEQQRDRALAALEMAIDFIRVRAADNGLADFGQRHGFDVTRPYKHELIRRLKEAIAEGEHQERCSPTPKVEE